MHQCEEGCTKMMKHTARKEAAHNYRKAGHSGQPGSDFRAQQRPHEAAVGMAEVESKEGGEELDVRQTTESTTAITQ